MSRRRIVAGVLALALVAVLIGRWERARWSETGSERMEQLLEVVGPSLVDRSVITTYAAGSATCFVYAESGRLYGLSLCFTSDGRLVETTDARDGTARFDTFRAAPALARVRVAPVQLRRTLRLLDERAAIASAATVAIEQVRACLDALSSAAVAPRRNLDVATGLAARHCRTGGDRIASLRRATLVSPLTSPDVDRMLAATEPLLAEAGQTLDAAARRDFGLLRRRRVVIETNRTLTAAAARPLAELVAARDAVAPRP